MRIIGGELKGHRLNSLDGKGIRPSADRLRESLFNLLGQTMEGETVLDGYAGTGAFGIEAISRGADFCCLVDQSPYAISLIQTNLDHCRIPAHQYQIVHTDFIQFITSTDLQFDTIFIDPPYRDYDRMPILTVILDCKRHLRSKGRIIFEHPVALSLSRNDLSSKFNVTSRKSGQSMITILQSEIK
ncbi:MAG: 16S rRNA (guanine(966)-N(2))-methyltransferase RsmD [Candidatus Delongbacteria bacterium]|nr:16S rRNA (guanine(966)-N(2))-methyltransferase RsmD [Candidatus Delongbacteria bacterium]